MGAAESSEAMKPAEGKGEAASPVTKTSTSVKLKLTGSSGGKEFNGHCGFIFEDNRAYKLICDTRGARFVEGTPRSFHDCNISDVHWSPLSPENFRAEIEKVVAEYANETFQEKEKLDSFWDHIAVATTLSKSLKKKIKEFFFSLWEEYDKVVSIVKALSLGAP